MSSLSDFSFIAYTKTNQTWQTMRLEFRNDLIVSPFLDKMYVFIEPNNVKTLSIKVKQHVEFVFVIPTKIIHAKTLNRIHNWEFKVIYISLTSVQWHKKKTCYLGKLVTLINIIVTTEKVESSTIEFFYDSKKIFRHLIVMIIHIIIRI